jgi:hypothetical protein
VGILSDLSKTRLRLPGDFGITVPGRALKCRDRNETQVEQFLLGLLSPFKIFAAKFADKSDHSLQVIFIAAFLPKVLQKAGVIRLQLGFFKDSLVGIDWLVGTACLDGYAY